jgi:hypothetical protein
MGDETVVHGSGASSRLTCSEVPSGADSGQILQAGMTACVWPTIGDPAVTDQWIVEDPTGGYLPRFGSVTFVRCFAENAESQKLDLTRYQTTEITGANGDRTTQVNSSDSVTVGWVSSY